MRHLTSGVFATALFLSCLQFETATAQTKPASKTDTGSVSGRVTVKGKPLPGIIVALSKGESDRRTKPILKSTTDEDGKYRITNVPAGAYQVTPMAPTFVFFDSSRGFGKDLLIADGEVIEGLDFAMIRGGVISGRVTDSEGRPVVEEFVHLEAVDQSFPLPPSAEAVQSDDRGIYRAFGVPP
ncbi:MAG TPA: carboxypeptidase regulatory-like domain-containing protein, partial [Pyrinomonadaceae bacterium]|nr:carboxypeptidase regulatory-like domain-containing protein [Pyrinomonadaceae bacterium]